jgi:dihydroorotase
MPPDDGMILIRGARLFDPAHGLDAEGSVLVKDGRIAAVGPGVVPVGEMKIIEADGKYLFPAFCDPHVHFRTPGQTEKEDISTGSMAALAGGFTTVVQMPNTSPVIDKPELVREVTADEPIELKVLGAVTYGSESRELTDFKALIDAGAVGLTDDGQGIAVPVFMKAALQFGAKRGVPIASHAEESEYGVRGVVRPGLIADSLGVPGWNPARESSMVERDIGLALETGGHVHFCHVSVDHSVEFIREAKRNKLRVTAEVTPHHLSLIVNDVPTIGADAKMNPPLGTEKDREVLIEALADGTIDCIATDHAPHTPEEKSRGLEKSPFGVIGLETSFSVIYTDLVQTGRIGLDRLIEAMTGIPRGIYNLEEVGLIKGSRADLVMVDPDKKWTVDPDKFESKARNCPFAGRELTGKVMWTMYRGKILWEYRE